MKLIKHINNNFAVAEDSVGNKVIVQGKGIGFGDLPRELKNFNGIVRTYYNVDEAYVRMINHIPSDVITLSGKIIDKVVNTINCKMSANIIFTLADHICFCIERYKKNMHVKMPIIHDVKNFYEKEYAIGVYALKLIREELQVFLPEEEATYIALHIINAEEMENNKSISNDAIISNITVLIEDEYDIKINKDSFNYSRFSSHMNYLLKRSKANQSIQSKNDKIFEYIKNEFPKSFVCANKISKYLEKEINVQLNDEEKLYLMLHINRLCSHEACN